MEAMTMIRAKTIPSTLIYDQLNDIFIFATYYILIITLHKLSI